MRILIVIVSRIGDTLFAYPSIKAISRFYENSEITVMAHPKRRQVFQNAPFIKHVKSITKNRASWLLGRKYYNLAFVYGFDESLVKYALRVSDSVIAFRQNNKRINDSLYKVVDVPRFQSLHAVDQLLRLPGSVGITTDDKRISFILNDNERLFSQHFFSKFTKKDQVFIGLQVASFPTKGYRDWPIGNFLLMCEKILKKINNAHFLIFGGPLEKERTVWLSRQLGENATLLAGKTDLRETAAIMSGIDLYIGVDTGPSHIMSAFDIPMVVLFHCLSSSAHTGAIGHPHYFPINHMDINCNKESSMGGISIELVTDTAIMALKSTS